MAKTAPILHSAPTWQPPRSTEQVFWHGCLKNAADAIQHKGIDFHLCNGQADFGRGFYLTTVRRQAELWAWKRYIDASMVGPRPVVLEITFARNALASLQGLHFVRADFLAEDFWSFVQHCRQNGTGHPADHARTTGAWYDIVSGPVAAFWQQRVAMQEADQYSLHETPNVKSLVKSWKGSIHIL